MKKIEIILLTITLILTTSIMCYFSYEKDDWDGDEMYTYSLSNSPKGGFITANIHSNTWFTGEDIIDVFTASDDNRFNYINVYRNQQNDVHPPFYYAIFHTISSIFPNTFSKWIGLSINIVSFIITSIFLYLISKKILKDTKLSCFVILLFGISIGTISNLLFIRMYMLFTMFSTIFTYLVLNNFLNNSTKYNYISLTICTFLGFMTHYYFLVYAFLLSAVYSIYLLINKKIKPFLKYVTSTVLGVIIGFILYPAAYRHMFKGYRGTESTSNLFSTSFIEQFSKLSKYLSTDLFFNHIKILLPIFLLICLLFITIFIKNKKNNKSSIFILITLLSIFLYTIIIIKMMPIIGTRYIYNIYPLIPLIIIYIINYLTQTIKFKKILLSISIITLSILSIYNLIVTTPSYLTDNESKNQLKILTTYNNYKMIYFFTSDYYFMCTSINLSVLDNIYMYEDKDSNLTEVFNSLEEENILVYFQTESNKEKYLTQILEETNYKSYKEYESIYIFSLE